MQLECGACGNLLRDRGKGLACSKCKAAASKVGADARRATRSRECQRCGQSKLTKDWPKDRGGTKLAHCGCVAAKPRFAALPSTVRERSALAKAGQPLALEWRTDWLEKKKQTRARAAELKGKKYQRVEELRGNVSGADAQWDDRHKAALQWVADERRKAAHRREMHDAHVQQLRGLSEGESWRWRYRNDSAFNAKERIRRQLRKKLEAVPGIGELLRVAVRTGKANSKVELVLGCSIEQFKEHIERQFVKGMGWDVWSKNGMHIDHILPRRCFDLTTIEGVQAYWSLSNLRPLWAKDNLRKGHKLEFII